MTDLKMTPIQLADEKFPCLSVYAHRFLRYPVVSVRESWYLFG